MRQSSDIDLLRKQLHEAQETLRAIRDGEVDAFVMQSRGIYRVEALAGADTPYRVLVESIRGGALTVSAKGVLLFCNRGFAEKVGVSASNLISTDVGQWLSVKPSLETLFDEARHGEAHGEGTLRTADGHIPVLATACALPNELGTPVFCIVLTDLSDRIAVERLLAEQASLERQRADLDAICRRLPFAVVLAEGPDLYCYTNPAADELFERYEELRRRANQAVVRARDGSPVAVEEVQLGEEAIFRLQVTLAALDGSKKRALVVIEDITSERHAHLARERQEQLRETFVGILGHDLRAPLMTIRAGTDLLGVLCSGEKVEHTVVRIQSAVGRMKHLIDDMLDLTLSRIGGGIPISRQQVDLSAVVRSALEDAGAVGDVRFDLETRGDTKGQWDAARLGQVVTNLVNNAIEHGSRSRPVRITLEGSDPKSVELAVSNDGPPIAAELLSSIFDPFRRGSPARTRGKGVGLGLYIAERIVSAHGGSISVRSGESEGTTFTVVLPRVARRALKPPSV